MRMPSLARPSVGKLALPVVAAVLTATGATPAGAQLDPRRGPPGCVPVAERQIERGCYIMVEHRLGALPTDVPLHWSIAAYPAGPPRRRRVARVVRWLRRSAASG